MLFINKAMKSVFLRKKSNFFLRWISKPLNDLNTKSRKSMPVSSPQDWNIKIQHRTKSILSKWVSWIINTKTYHINGLYFIFCIYLQYIQMYNMYVISPAPSTHTKTRIGLALPWTHLRAFIFILTHFIQLLT